LGAVVENRANTHSQGSNSPCDCRGSMNPLRWSLENPEDF